MIRRLFIIWMTALAIFAGAPPHVAHATVNSTVNKTIALGNGSATQFNFSFIGVAAAYISVIYTDASGNETALTQGSGATQYQITLNAPVTGAIWGLGGTITYDPNGTPIASGTTLTIFRTLPLTQAISLQNQISLSTLGNGSETGLDTGVMQNQQTAENIARAIVAPIVDATPPLPLPPIAQRANQGAAFDSQGNMIAGAIPGSGVISSAMQPVVNAATLALGRTAFGIGTAGTEGIGSGLQDDGAGNLRVNTSALTSVSVNQTVTSAFNNRSFAATGPITFTLPRANTLWNGFSFWVHVVGGVVTIAPNAADTISGLASGVSTSVTSGGWIYISVDAATSGTWYTSASQGSSVENVVAYGADPSGVTDSTAAFAAAVTAAKASGGKGVVFVPPVSAGGCYKVTALNLTGINGLTINGNGDQSQICPSSNGDAQGNWWDFSASNNIQLRNLKIAYDGSHIPAFLMTWMCTGTNCNGSGVLGGFTLDHVNFNAKSTQGFFYGYGYGCVSGCASGGSLNISNSTWLETNNGASTTPDLVNAPLVLDALNHRNIRSAYVTVTSTQAVVWRTVISNVDFVDFSNGASLSNNAAAVFYNTNQLTMAGGSFQCVCVTDAVMWSNNEGLTFIQTAFEQPNGGGGTTLYWVEMGGGLNGFVTFITPLWSSPGGGYIALDQGISTNLGGTLGLKVIGNDVGSNSATAPFIAETNNHCGPFVSTNSWITLSNLDFVLGANTVNGCGNIDPHTIFQNVGSVTLAGSGVDSSHHF